VGLAEGSWVCQGSRSLDELGERHAVCVCVCVCVGGRGGPGSSAASGKGDPAAGQQEDTGAGAGAPEPVLARPGDRRGERPVATLTRIPDPGPRERPPSPDPPLP
jgi:hypothetical protein